MGITRELRGQAMALVKQLSGEPKPAVVTPRQLVAEGHWPSGGHMTLQEVAQRRARAVLDSAQPLLNASLHSPHVARVARHVSDACMALLMTQLPTPRPRSLYTLVTKGVHGVSPPSNGRYCSVMDCRRVTCPGNVLERVGERKFVFVQSHHKTERLISVPTIHLSAAAGSAPMLLDCLELVHFSCLAAFPPTHICMENQLKALISHGEAMQEFTWAKSRLLASYGQLRSSKRHAAFRSVQDGQPLKDAVESGRMLKRVFKKAMAEAGLPPVDVTANKLRHMVGATALAHIPLYVYKTHVSAI